MAPIGETPKFLPSQGTHSDEAAPLRGRRTSAPDRKPVAAGRVKKPTARPIHFLDRWVVQGQDSQLDRLAAKAPNQSKLFEMRQRDLRRRTKSLSMPTKVALAMSQIAARLNVLRSSLMRAIHPAIDMYREQPQLDEASIAPLVDQGKARRVHFFTRDHVMLDGFWLRAEEAADTLGTPMLLIGLGNAMVYEQLIPMAATLAKPPHNINVLLYNDRGVGKSLGQQLSTQQAVLDCRAALQFARQHSNNLGVFGISLGGGVTAEALSQAQHAGELAAQDVGIYVNCHSFASLSQCIGNLFHPWLGPISRALFSLVGMNDLSTAKTLQSRRLARDVVVLTASDDRVMRGSGRLVHALQNCTVDNLQLHESAGFDHNEIADYFRAESVDHGSHLSRWAERRQG